MRAKIGKSPLDHANHSLSYIYVTTQAGFLSIVYFFASSSKKQAIERASGRKLSGFRQLTH